MDAGGAGMPRGSEPHGMREVRPGKAPPLSGEVVRMTGSLLCCWRRGVAAAACKTNLVL